MYTSPSVQGTGPEDALFCPAGAPSMIGGRTRVTDDNPEESELEIGTLLAAAFEKEPSADLGDRVVRRVALATTVAEIAQMFTAAPLHWLRSDLEPDEGGDGGQGQ